MLLQEPRLAHLPCPVSVKKGRQVKMRYAFVVVLLILLVGSAHAAPWVIYDAGLGSTANFVRLAGGTLVGRSQIDGDPGMRFAVKLSGTGWKDIQIGDNYPVAAATGNSGDLSNYSGYTMTVKNSNDSGWFWIALYMNTGYGSADRYYQHSADGIWLGPGQTAVLRMDFAAAARWAGSGYVTEAVINRNQVTNIGMKIASNMGTADYQMPSDVTFNIDVLGNFLTLNVESESLYVGLDEPVVINMDVSSLNQKVNACQAMLGYSSDYFADPTGGCVSAGGDIWDQVIWDSWNVPGVDGEPGKIDTAIGVNANGTVGTSADSTVAKITLTSKTEGVTQLVFRPDLDPDPYLVQTTLLGDMTGTAVWPNKIDSRNIVIDGTPPSLSFTAVQNGANVKTGNASTTSPVTIQGQVAITVNASDALAGLKDSNPVTVSVDGIATGPVSGSSGVYTCTATVGGSTSNGAHLITVTATDNSGNVATLNDWLYVNKNQISGTVTMESYQGGDREVTFCINGANPFNKSLTFNTSGVASYTLVDVPDGVTSLSAKSAWYLRHRLDFGLDENGQAAGKDFFLPGGDLNESNSINVLDYSVLKVNWNTTSQAADINGDGVVSVPDYNIMKGNWFALGDSL